MLRPSDLIGVWSADVMYGPGAQSDDVLFLFDDGKGRLEFHNPGLCNAWSFKWNITDDGRIHVVGDLAYSCEKSVITVRWDHDIHHSVSVKMEYTPCGPEMRVLRISQRLVSGLSDHFAFCHCDVAEFEDPDFSSMNRRE